MIPADGTLKYLMRRLRGDDGAVKPVNVDAADSSSAPRLQHPENYDRRALDMITRADVTTTGLGDFWPGSASIRLLPECDAEERLAAAAISSLCGRWRSQAPLRGNVAVNVCT